MKYAVIIEAGERNYSAYVPDLPGCIATGKTLEEVTQVMREASREQAPIRLSFRIRAAETRTPD